MTSWNHFWEEDNLASIVWERGQLYITFGEEDILGSVALGRGHPGISSFGKRTSWDQ